MKKMMPNQQIISKIKEEEDKHSYLSEKDYERFGHNDTIYA